jgi:hypothetical protein
VGIQ